MQSVPQQSMVNVLAGGSSDSSTDPNEEAMEDTMNDLDDRIQSAHRPLSSTTDC